MSNDANENNEDGNTKSGRKPLTLKRTEQGSVKQSFSHGRSKTVVVETKKRRTLTAPKTALDAKADNKKAATKTSTTKKTITPKKVLKPKTDASTQKEETVEKTAKEPAKKGAVLRTLSDDEKQARASALAKARKDSEARRIREAADSAEREKREAEERKRLEANKQQLEEEEKKRAKEAEVRRIAEAEAQKALEAEEAARELKKRAGTKKSSEADKNEAIEKSKADPDNPLAQLGGRLKTKRKEVENERRDSKSRDVPRRRTGRLTIANALDDDDRQRSLASVKRAREREKLARRQRGETKKIAREVIIPETITVQELAQRMAMRAVDLVRELMKQGQMVTGNDILDADTAQLIAEDLGHSVKRVAESDVEEGLTGPADNPEDLQPRPPVVTIMGHVDHGKTSLLDAMRETDVVTGEAGGITQHIGAYQVTLENERKITFLDTPGHAAFTQMRARGAEVTDIVILVVAADDSIMPQTEEAISHAKAAGVPIIVAINKIDKPDADANRVRTDLLKYEIQVESMGGDIQDVEVSALKKTNLDGLQEAILLQADLLELTANPDRAAEGAVVETRLDKGRGTVATLLVERGTLKRGDIVVAGAEWGKVRATIDDKGKKIDGAGPALPVEILGLNGVPEPGDQFVVLETEARAREVAEFRTRQRKEKSVAKSSGTSLESMMAQLQDAEIKEMPLVIKGDVQGSVEAIVGSLEKLSTEEVRVRVLHTGVGGVSESDVVLAGASGAPVIGFNVRANKDARIISERDNVEIRYYSVIYDLIDDVKGVLSGMLEPELRETFIGNAEILEVFNISKHGKVAGCRVTEGHVKRGAKVRLIRDNVVIHEGELGQLKRFKDDVQEVTGGQECGMSFTNYEDMRAGDVIECFNVETIKRSL